jgi:hypothetical protein
VNLWLRDGDVVGLLLTNEEESSSSSPMDGLSLSELLFLASQPIFTATNSVCYTAYRRWKFAATLKY